MTMDRFALQERLRVLAVPFTHYSLQGELIPDAIILTKDKGYWKVFYLDEKGHKHDEQQFSTEAAACAYIHHYFLQETY
ncbi:hypothetical protein [Algivirga pacifica]|uniref:Uncharacterized protein n=1 Tax=Algivirga pacifica TaxID=1162670 RepID=A0ABP9DGW1_9BACT